MTPVIRVEICKIGQIQIERVCGRAGRQDRSRCRPNSRNSARRCPNCGACQEMQLPAAVAVKLRVMRDDAAVNSWGEGMGMTALTRMKEACGKARLPALPPVA